MMSKEQALHKAERQFSQLKNLVGRAIREGWRADELERATFADLLDMGFSLLTAFVAAQGSGDQGEQIDSRQMDQYAESFRASQPMPPPEEEGELLVATADGKGVPMRRLADPAAPPRVVHRRGKGEKANKKQMSYVGGV